MAFFKAGKYLFDLSLKIFVMGILNITPDSFSDGGLYELPQKACKRAFEIQDEGADILDIGAQSTRPGYTKISEEEEWRRLQPVLSNLKKKLNIPISVDTFYHSVALKALDAGADIINDVSGNKSDEMLRAVSNHDCGIIIMHNSDDMNIKSFFQKSLASAVRYGIDPQRICFDPGFGFSKNRKQDAFIIKNLNNIKLDSNGVLIGISRKRIIGEFCGNPPPHKRMAGTLAANTICAVNGANIIRVHDVKESVQAMRVADTLMRI